MRPTGPIKLPTALPIPFAAHLRDTFFLRSALRTASIRLSVFLRDLATRLFIAKTVTASGTTGTAIINAGSGSTGAYRDDSTKFQCSGVCAVASPSGS